MKMNCWILVCCSLAATLLFGGCHSDKAGIAASTASPPAVSSKGSEPVAIGIPVKPAPPNAGAAAQPDAKPNAIRIKAGSSSPVTDAAGHVWLADQGFEGGDVIERPDLEIANTKIPEVYRSEHYSMESFSYKLPNGKYQVRLHFAETFDGISGPGQRVFSFNVQGQEFKDVDVWKKSGGALRAYVETVPVNITDGKLSIKFISNIENPQINGIEIIPES